MKERISVIIVWGASVRGIEDGITGNEINIVIAIGGGRTTTHPDSPEAHIGRHIQYMGDREIRRIEPDHPSVVWSRIFMGGPCHVDNSVDQRQTRPLALLLRVETDRRAAIACTRKGHIRSNVGRPAKLFVAGGQINRVEPLEKGRP